MKFSVKNRTLALTIVVALGAMTSTTISAERTLMLDDAIALALEKNEDIFVSRESAEAAEAAVFGARGVFNPVFELSSGWQRVREPGYFVNTGTVALDETQKNEGVEASAVISQYLPTGAFLSLQATTSRGTSTSAYDLLSPAYQARLGVEFRQPLLRNLSTDRERLAIRVAETDRKRSDAELKFTTTEIVAAVERTYWILAAARAEVSVREEAVRLAEEQLAETQEKVTSGSAPETETAQPLAELERRRGELLASHEASSRAETALKTLVLSDSDAGLWEDALDTEEDRDIVVIPEQRGQSMEKALASRPELEMTRAIVDGRKAELSYTNNSLWPSLDAVLSYERFGVSGRANPAASSSPGSPIGGYSGYDGGWGRAWDQISGSDFDDVRAGFIFSFPIGNDAAEAARDMAHHSERQAEADLARVRKSVRADVLNALAALETASQRIEAARAGREAAEIQLSAEQDRYDIGLSTNFLVLTRQNDLSRARLDEISTRADYRIANSEYARATGTLLERHQIEID